MDLTDILETLVELDTTKPWNIIINQVAFDCYRKFCLDYIQEEDLVLRDKCKEWNSIYELCEKYVDDSFKPYLDEIFSAEHLEEFENSDICLVFFKKFIATLDILIENDSENETKITDFLDYNIFKYFEIMLSDDLQYYIFPKTFEDDLNVKAYEEFKIFIENAPVTPAVPLAVVSEVINEPIEKQEPKEVTKSISKALLFRRKTFRVKTKKNNGLLKSPFSNTRKNVVTK